MAAPETTTKITAADWGSSREGTVVPPAPKVESTVQKAHTFLEEASSVMKQRAALRDKPEGERSMAAIVKTFNTLSGKDLTEAEGWEFMILLKMVRGRQGNYNRDDYVDGSAYFGLLGECKSGEKK